MSFKVCVIGCGFMGKGHAKAWNQREDTEIVSVCDIIKQRRVDMASEYQAADYESYKDAIQHPGVDVVSVCVPTYLHCDFTCFAAEKGKHVLCEKPIALDAGQAELMIETANKQGVLLSTSFQYRGHKRNEIYRRLYKDGKFGSNIIASYIDVREVRPKLAMHRESMNGGPVIDLTCHYTDLMRFITESEPSAVSASGSIFGKGKKRLAGIEDLAIDSFHMKLEMTSGDILSLLINWGMPEGFPDYQAEYFVGSDISASICGDSFEVRYPDHTECWPNIQPGVSVRVNQLVQAIKGEADLEVTGEDGKIALNVSLAALESIKSGQMVSCQKQKKAELLGAAKK